MQQTGANLKKIFIPLQTRTFLVTSSPALSIAEYKSSSQTTSPKSTVVKRLIAGLIKDSSEFLSLLRVSTKAIRLFQLFSRILLATSRAFILSGISMNEKLKKMNLNLSFKYCSMVQKSMLQIQICLSSLKSSMALSVYSAVISTPTILECFFLISPAISLRGLPVPQPTSKKLPSDRVISLTRLRWAAIVKKVLMKRSQMKAETCLTSFNILLPKNYIF